ncbi:hypothetical protein D9M69_158630 [compost metagenome]
MLSGSGKAAPCPAHAGLRRDSTDFNAGFGHASDSLRCGQQRNSVHIQVMQDLRTDCLCPDVSARMTPGVLWPSPQHRHSTAMPHRGPSHAVCPAPRRAASPRHLPSYPAAREWKPLHASPPAPRHCAATLRMTARDAHRRTGPERAPRRDSRYATAFRGKQMASSAISTQACAESRHMCRLGWTHDGSSSVPALTATTPGLASSSE